MKFSQFYFGTKNVKTSIWEIFKNLWKMCIVKKLWMECENFCTKVNIALNFISYELFEVLSHTHAHKHTYAYILVIVVIQ